MKNLRIRTLWLRWVAEFERFGSILSLLRRIRDILRHEGISGIWHRLRVLTRRAPNSVTDAPPLPGTLLIGHAEAILGVGENFRAIACALKYSRVPFSTFDVINKNSNHSLNSITRHRSNLFCLNANEMDSALAEMGSEMFASSYNIGLWMWELSIFPKKWHSKFRYVQEIWAQSHFVYDSIAAVSPVPTIWMPQPVEPGPADPIWASRLGVPTERFSFLCFVDFRSFAARKNPSAAAEAFRIAFGNSDNGEVLVIKTLGSETHPNDYRIFCESVRDLKSRVIVINQQLTDEQIKGLLCGCNAFISLHRSEGFGRGIAEAMYYSKPTIATAYSGNMDFCTQETCALVDYQLIPVNEGEYPFWKDQVWANPDLACAADWMQRISSNPLLSTRIGQLAQKQIRSSNSAAAVGKKIKDRLSLIGLI